MGARLYSEMRTKADVANAYRFMSSRPSINVALADRTDSGGSVTVRRRLTDASASDWRAYELQALDPVLNCVLQRTAE